MNEGKTSTGGAKPAKTRYALLQEHLASLEGISGVLTAVQKLLNEELETKKTELQELGTKIENSDINLEEFKTKRNFDERNLDTLFGSCSNRNLQNDIFESISA